MICEICGRNFNTGVRIQLEGSVVSVCDNCAGYGKVISRINTVKEKPKAIESSAPVYDMQDVAPKETLVEDWSLKIKNAREKRKLKQGDLAKLINEPESLVHRLEAGKIEPDDTLVRKLEKKLNIKLMIKEEAAERFVGSGGKDGRTLGDLVVIRKKKEGA
jgi:putative transcription factor